MSETMATNKEALRALQELKDYLDACEVAVPSTDALIETLQSSLGVASRHTDRSSKSHSIQIYKEGIAAIQRIEVDFMFLDDRSKKLTDRPSLIWKMNIDDVKSVFKTLLGEDDYNKLYNLCANKAIERLAKQQPKEGG